MDEHTPRKPSGPIIAAVVFAATALMACLGLVIVLYLPDLVTQRLPIEQIRKLGFADFKGRVTKIGMNQTMAGPFRFGHADQPAVTIQSVAIDYSLGELRQKRVRRVSISNIQVFANLGPDGVTLPGLDTAMLSDKKPNAVSSPVPSTLGLDMTVEKIELRSGMLILTWRNATYRIPFAADLTIDGPDMANWVIHLHLFPSNQRLTLTVMVDLASRTADLDLEGSAMVLDAFAGVFHHIPGLDLTGQATIRAKARLHLSPVALSDARVDIVWRNGQLTYASAAITPDQDSLQAHLSATSENLKNWQVNAAGLRLLTPAPVAMKALRARLEFGDDTRAVAGSAELSFLPFTVQIPWAVALKKQMAIVLDINASQQVSGNWRADLKTRARSQSNPLVGLHATISGLELHGPAPHINVTANGNDQGGSVHWQLDLKSLQAAAAGVTVALSNAFGTGQLQLARRRSEPAWSGHARAQIPAVRLEGRVITGKLKNLVLSTQFQGQADTPLVFDAKLNLASGQLHHTPSGLKLSEIRLDFPYQADPINKSDPGSFSIGRIIYQQELLGDFQGRITQKKDAFHFSATHTSHLFPTMAAIVTGTLRPRDWRHPHALIAFDMPSYVLPADFDLGQWVPAAMGMTISGRVSARGQASVSPADIRGDFDLVLQDGGLRMEQKQIVVEGIHTRLHFPDLPRIRSEAALPLQFERAAMGTIVVDGGSFDYQVESEKTLFIEKGRLYWCGGKLDAQSLRITADKQAYQVSLYCQRLALSQLLEQLGMVNAKGTGTVNGRIPILYSNGRFRFDDGFLFSTPGEAGQIQITGTDVLTRGIPPGTPQMAQVELAREALKDYVYEWAKLGLVSEGEDFIMRLQFDGKPVNPLPFVYSKEIGGFVRVEAGAQGSVFQGIALDVNLRLPLNQLLQYKDIVNMID
ncbi:MAG: YdbH domain-containing protein [Desulfosarcina sp.]|jgi:hypothetical protein